jgi:predicted dehydrogenase
VDSNKVLSFGVVGCGRVSSKHLIALSSQIPAAKLVAVCDVNLERAKLAGNKYKVPFYSSSHEMVKNHPEIDVLNILTPSGDHCQNVLELVGYGKHFVVEKPLALTITDAEKMIASCSEAGVKLFVVQQNRYNLPVQRLYQAVKEGRFGKLVLGTVRLRWCRTQEYYDSDDWRGTWARDGGVFANQANHHIDLLAWLMGEVDTVFAYSTARLVDIESDDTAVAVLRFASGALGVIEATTATRPTDLEGSISILGEGGTVEVSGFAVNQVRSWEFVQKQPADSEMSSGFQEDPPDVYGFGHARYLQSVVDSMNVGKGGAVDGLESLKSLTLISALYESAETGKEVPLRFRARHAKLGIRDLKKG